MTESVGRFSKAREGEVHLVRSARPLLLWLVSFGFALMLPWLLSAQTLGTSQAKRPRIHILLSISGLGDARDQAIQAHLAAQAHSVLGEQYDVRLVYQATAQDLAWALTDSDADGLVYVSHGTQRGLRAGALGISGHIIRDYYGQDVTPILRRSRGGAIRYLGLVSCDGAETALHLMKTSAFMPGAMLLSDRQRGLLFSPQSRKRGRAYDRVIFAPSGEAELFSSYARALRSVDRVDWSVAFESDSAPTSGTHRISVRAEAAPGEALQLWQISIRDWPIGTLALGAGSGSVEMPLDIPKVLVEGQRSSEVIIRIEARAADGARAPSAQAARSPRLSFQGAVCEPLGIGSQKPSLYRCRI